jgi:hypothetical protein
MEPVTGPEAPVTHGAGPEMQTWSAMAQFTEPMRHAAGPVSHGSGRALH